MEESKKYIKMFFKDILSYKDDIFLFCREYYRWIIREKSIESFPVFDIRGNANVSCSL